MRRDKRDNWIKAMDDGMEALIQNNTWGLVQLPECQKSIGG